MNLSVVGYGQTTCDAHWGFTTEGEAFHRMYYVQGGFCRCTLGGKTHVLEPGVLYLLPSHVPYAMAHDPAHPFAVLWQHLRLSDRDTGRCIVQMPVVPQTAIWHVLEAMDGVSCGALVERIQQPDDVAALQLEYLCLALFALLEREQPVFQPMDHRLSEIYALVMDNPQTHYTVGQMASYAKLERSHFSRLWSGQFHISAQAFLIRTRLDQAAQLLLAGGSVTDGAASAGYSDVKAFSRAFTSQYCVTPSKYKRNHILQP